MSQIWNLTKLFGRMFLLREKPSSVPYSLALLVVVTIVYFITKIPLYLWLVHIIDQIDIEHIIILSFSGAFIIPTVWVLILFAMLNSVLSYYKLKGRFVQTATSFLAMDCILNIFYLLWICSTTLLTSPFELGPSFTSMMVILGFVLIMYWQFMVYINLLVYSLDVSLVTAGIFSLFYMLLQQNVSELILKVIITVIEV